MLAPEQQMQVSENRQPKQYVLHSAAHQKEEEPTLFYIFSSKCHTETRPAQKAHLPVSENDTTSTSCSCMLLLLLTSLLSFSPRTAFIFPLFTSDCLNESFSEE